MQGLINLFLLEQFAQASPSERGEFWAKRDLAQASVTYLSEGSWLVLCMVLAQVRLLRYLHGELAGVPWVVARNVSLSCGSG
ncbi:hypothetical protein DEO72_LG2g4189 [Vigna unguiculata]|uniref:Uncharacterized protein n=1 Tax=Vigna unguiculata TaxID=3917 RepID=A0A4D6L5N5_VIGUN|nr:hypothetical protein DEO72_LG2g4189 [Vigna unguiculata]